MVVIEITCLHADFLVSEKCFTGTCSPSPEKKNSGGKRPVLTSCPPSCWNKAVLPGNHPAVGSSSEVYSTHVWALVSFETKFSLIIKIKNEYTCVLYLISNTKTNQNQTSSWCTPVPQSGGRKKDHISCKHPEAKQACGSEQFLHRTHNKGKACHNSTGHISF